MHRTRRQNESLLADLSLSKILNLILNSPANLKNGVNVVVVKWESFSEISPERNYFAYAGYAERKSAWSYFSYLMRARKVANQLHSAKGLIGFTAQLEFFSKKVVQLAVFEDENALQAFAHAGQHALCMEMTKSSMKWLKQARWSISGSDIPPKIDDAINRIQSQK